MFTASSAQNRHIPVMLMESLENLKIKKNGVYVDGTLGLGGHSESILRQIDSGLLIGIDRDEKSILLAMIVVGYSDEKSKGTTLS